MSTALRTVSAAGSSANPAATAEVREFNVPWSSCTSRFGVSLSLVLDDEASLRVDGVPPLFEALLLFFAGLGGFSDTAAEERAEVLEGGTLWLGEMLETSTSDVKS